jgi:ATP-dependent metalloprotease FtsH
MFQDLNKKKNTNAINIMVFSAITITILLVYVLLQDNNTKIDTNNYIIGISMLAIMLAFAFRLNKKNIVSKKNVKTEVSNNNSSKNIQDNLSSIEPTTTTIHFDDIAGIDEVKEELTQVVDFLNKPDKYLKYDVSLPKGVLLVGPPGVGKTMIAKAVACEANVPFYYQSGASFVHIYVGMGAKKVRELFTVAKSQSPSIIFIDEIDAIGKTRGVSGNDEREATLNELLTQMDGFDDKSTVMVIAATNKVDLLDDALLRAGRFDRIVHLQLPNKDDRKKILLKSCEKRNYNFDINKLAADTIGFNSAALVTLINEALLNMIERSGTTIVEDDIVVSKQKLQFGKKQLVLLDDEQKNILAIYQASKAFITQQRVKLFEEGLVFDEIVYPSKKQMIDRIKALLSGSVGLDVFLNQEYIVYENDIKQAYEIADEIVNRYKLSTLSVDELIQEAKISLKIIINEKKNDIMNIKEILLKDEVVF